MQKQNKLTQIALTIGLSILCILVLFPFWLLVAASFTDSNALTQNGYQVWPNPFTLEAYKIVFADATPIIKAYGVTAVFSIATMVGSLLFMSLIAYPLSRQSLKGRGIINFYIYFTMLFNGGLVPTYLIVAGLLHLNDTIWVYILPALTSPWHIFMMRTFFQGIPGEIIESASMDGASEFRILFTMIMPLSKPVLATVALMTFLSQWNNWNTALIYISNPDLFSLQYFLQKMMENIRLITENPAIAGMFDLSSIPTETVRMAMAIVVAGPALVVFPFFQKYFVKGLTVGSVKG